MLYTGTVEDRQDPLKLGRCRVRIIGLHTHDKSKLPTHDLPWAYPMQPITSAAMSGIGSTPLGLVEGTWVVVMFQDEDNQYPIILGSIGGIPQRDELLESDDSTLQIKIGVEEAKTNGQSVLDGSGNPIMTGSGVPLTTGQQTFTNTNSLRRASQFTPSQACIDLIKRYEGLRLNAYQDSGGVWTIGYGTTRINGQTVQPGLTITRGEAERLLAEDLVTEGVRPVASNVRVLLTQSMFDALCSFTYNVGVGNLRKSTLLKDLNSEKYLDGAAGFSLWNKAGGVVLAGLTNRRNAEKELFLREGIPNQSGELPSEVQQSQASTRNPATSSDSGSTATQATVSSQGFKDPTGKYPLYFNEPDTNRLARHEEIQKTIVYKKEAAIDKNVRTAGGVTWNQPPIPYNAQYPFNHVMQTESGHVLEFDDSPQSERIHIYHKAGTFSEIDANGTRVNRIVGDDYEILERNGYVHINGNLNVTVDGSKNVLVSNALNLDVAGVANINVFNDANLNVSGSLNASVRESFKLKAASVFIEGESVDIKSIAGPIRVDASQNLELKSSTRANLEGPTVHLAEGHAGAARLDTRALHGRCANAK
jgi:GH24 family phage-related lysozyme (muramidase)